jgi:hypothetical protein
VVSVEFCMYVLQLPVNCVWFCTGSWLHNRIHWSLSHKFTKPHTFSCVFFVISYLPAAICQYHGHLSDSLLFFLGVMTKLWKATISFVMSVSPSIHMEQISPSPPYRFSWNLYLRVFQKSVEKIQVGLKSYKDNRYFTCRTTYIYDHILLNSS